MDDRTPSPLDPRDQEPQSDRELVDLTPVDVDTTVGGSNIGEYLVVD